MSWTPGPQYAVLALSATASAPITLARGYRPLSIEVPSWGVAAFCTLQFAQTSGGPTWSTLFTEGTGQTYIIFSGTAGGFVRTDPPPTSVLRIVASSCQSAVMTFTVLE